MLRMFLGPKRGAHRSRERIRLIIKFILIKSKFIFGTFGALGKWLEDGHILFLQGALGDLKSKEKKCIAM